MDTVRILYRFLYSSVTWGQTPCKSIYCGLSFVQVKLPNGLRREITGSGTRRKVSVGWKNVVNYKTGMEETFKDNLLRRYPINKKNNSNWSLRSWTGEMVTVRSPKTNVGVTLLHYKGGPCFWSE